MDKFDTSINWNVKDELQGKELEEIKAVQPRLGFSVAAINIDGELNIGMMLRSAVIFGANTFYIFGKKRYDKRSTVGAQNYINIVKQDLELFDACMLVANIKPIFFEPGGEKYIPFDVFRKGLYHPCFVFGSEKEGIPASIVKKQQTYAIPQYGVLRSLNVSAAASIVMYRQATFVKGDW